MRILLDKVHSEAWKQTYEGIFLEEFLREDTVEKRKQEFIESFSNKDCLYYVVYEDVTPVGIVKIVEETDACEIASFYILEKYRNKGYGKQTVEYLKKELLPKRIKLWVLKDNAKAIKFYETNRFAFSGNTRLIDRGRSYVQLQYECIYDICNLQVC